MLDLLLEELDQLLHGLPVPLHLISKAWVKLDCCLLVALDILPGVSITVTGFPASPCHLIYQLTKS